MRKLVTVTFVTLDGIMQAPGGPEEDESDGFNSGGWSVNYWDDLMGQDMGETFAKQPELLLGRKTYEVFAAYWPNARDEPGADNLNNAKKYVVSRTLERVDWENSTLIKGDVVKEIKSLKELNGPEIQVHGSCNLIQTLLKHNLIDELHLWIFPVAIGKGKRFFGEGTHPSGFKLIESKPSSTGVIIATYEQSGDLKTGTFALDQSQSR
jgi:dihydrofolate reductase